MKLVNKNKLLDTTGYNRKIGIKIMQTSKFEKYMIQIYQNNPKLRPIMKKVRGIVRPIPAKFLGWGMTSIHTPPWNNHSDAKIFLNAVKDIKKNKI